MILCDTKKNIFSTYDICLYQSTYYDIFVPKQFKLCLCFKQGGPNKSL